MLWLRCGYDRLSPNLDGRPADLRCDCYATEVEAALAVRTQDFGGSKTFRPKAMTSGQLQNLKIEPSTSTVRNVSWVIGSWSFLMLCNPIVPANSLGVGLQVNRMSGASGSGSTEVTVPNDALQRRLRPTTTRVFSRTPCGTPL